MLVTMKAILDRASAENYAVAAPNVGSELDARAAIEIAEELNAPIILDVHFTHHPDFEFIGPVFRKLAEQSKVPVAINLDHGSDFHQAILAIRSGFTSVMVDRSSLPYEENVKQVKEIVKIAHEVGVSVEAELGHVGNGENLEDGNVYTDPKEALQYIQETGVDCLAVSVGTAHGAYVNVVPKLQFDILKEIKEATNNFPLVMHGGSGTGDEQLRKACSMGINKVNLCNDLLKAAVAEVVNANTEGNGAYDLWVLVKKGFKRRLGELIEILGGKGKAWVPEVEGLPTFEIKAGE